MVQTKENKEVPVGLFLVARTGSTRLPCKSMLQIQGKPMIEHQIERLKPARLPSVFALATTTLPEDEALCEVAQRCRIECFQGSIHDVVERLVRAAEHYGVEFVTCVGGDDVFCEAELVDAVIVEYTRDKADFITIADVPFGATPFGVTRSGIKTVLDIKGDASTDGWERYFTDTGFFCTKTVRLNDSTLNYPDLRLDLDYPEDYELIQAIYKRLYLSGRPPSLREVVRLLTKDEPALVEINRAVHQKWLEVRAKQALTLRRVPKIGV